MDNPLVLGIRSLGSPSLHKVAVDYGPFGGPAQMTAWGGLLGAGVGAGAGWLYDRFIGDSFDDAVPGIRNIRGPRTMAMLGAGLGASPGMIFGISNFGKGYGVKGLYSNPHRGKIET